MSNMYGVGYDDPYGDQYTDPFGEDLLSGYGAFDSTGLDFNTAYGADPLSVGYLDDDQLVAAKRRADLLKAMYGMLFDSRTGYYGAAEAGRPTFNFPGLTAGSGVEQAGTAEAGSPAEGDIIGFDMEGNPIMSSGTSGGGSGGSGGGRSSGMSPQAANRFLTGLGNSEGEYGPILSAVPKLLETQTPAAVKLKMRADIGNDVDPDTLKLLDDTIDQAWEASGVTSGQGELPKSSDLGIQVGKWGTVDPTKAYTPESLPEDVLGQLGPDYLSNLDEMQSSYEQANERWNRYLKANKGQDAFQLWREKPELTMDDAIAQTGGRAPGAGQPPTFASPGQAAGTNPNNLPADQAYTIDSPADADRLYGTGGGPAAINPNNLDLSSFSITDPASANEAIGRAAAGQHDPSSGTPGAASLIQGVLAAANRERGKNTPYATDKAGGLLNYVMDVNQDEAKELGLSNWDTFQFVPGQKRKVYTSEEGATALRQRRTAKAIYERNAKSNAALRAAIAQDLATRGRTPQRDDMRARQNMLRNQLGI